MPTIDIEDIKRLTIKPGDMLLVTVPRATTAARVHDIKGYFEAHLPVRVIVKTADVEVEVIGEDEGNEGDG